MRAVCFPLFMTLIVACAPQDIETSRSASYPEYPESLIRAFEAACSDTGERILRPSRTSIECRQLMPPQTTAYLILTYDGTPEKLPESVMRMSVTEISGGHRVDTEFFLDIPRKDRGVTRVRIESDRLDRKVARLLRATGGTSL